MEPDILIIDEVLAVGDAEFQKKCLGKMDDIAKKEGRTILFVSHNLSAMQSLCSRAFLLKKGRLVKTGTPKEVISEYLNVDSETLTDRNLSKIRNRRGGNTDLRLMSFDAVDLSGKSLTDVPCGSKVNFELNFEVLTDEVNNLRVGISFKDRNTGIAVTDLNSYYGSKEILSCKKGNHKYVFTVDHLPLAPNQYTVGFIATSGLQVLDWLRDACQLTVSEGLFYESGQMPQAKNSQIFFTEYTCELVKDNK
jgi:lipopolysaccharide transport system ATP-binding protein